MMLIFQIFPVMVHYTFNKLFRYRKNYIRTPTLLEKNSFIVIFPKFSKHLKALNIQHLVVDT